MSWKYLRGATHWALMAGLVFGASAFAQAEEESDGNIVQIGRSDKAPARPNLPSPRQGDEDDQARPAAPTYWIGLLGGAIPADHPLRAQLDLPEHQGLLVANVVPKSPAAKAGLKQYDVLLKANGKDLHEMKDLIDLVMQEGAKKGQITLDVLRRNKHETVNLKPEDRPADEDVQQSGGGMGGGFGQLGSAMPGAPPAGRPGAPGMPRPFQFRNFGPGVIVGGGDPFAGMPNGVSISVQKENDKPTHITVQRGNDKWDITGDDPEALKKLPEDLRPTVERMLHGGGGMAGAMSGFGQFQMPNGPAGLGPGFGPGMDPGQFREQMERMERRLDELQRQMHGPPNRPADQQNDTEDQSK
jgi:hypothetical protein